MDYSPMKLAALLTAGFISGCASNSVYEGRYPWDAGWRKGSVDAVGEDDQMRARYAQRCKVEAAQAARFARIRYIEMGKARMQTVAVPKDSTLTVGDLVYVKVFDCAGQALPRDAPTKSGVRAVAGMARRHA
ncbi:hypothetical protein FN976_24065 [Caenimonas sedimenti]|uniref:Lipoprotein n=1 Tax=Caenimonas sedimenti TaxID=2596921 RepID=A0A562ZHY8_9BURK|nr:hypothetical protein [Caenimonas sedimenti]TWO68021.1 hypothetical protein FN976_24065 [Caenimonas sedimenti]